MELKEGQLCVLRKYGYYATYISKEPYDCVRVFLEKTLDKEEGALSGMLMVCSTKEISLP